MKRLFMAFLIVVFLAVPVVAKEVKLVFSWSANSEPDMKGYALFVRQEGQAYDYNDPKDPTCTIVDGLCYVDTVAKICEFEHEFTAPDGVISTFYFVCRAKDTDGNWSRDSNEIFQTYDLRVMPNPTMLAGAYNDMTKTIVFFWEQPDADRVVRWELFKSFTTGGPYIKVGELANTGQISPYSMSWAVPGDGDYYFTVVAFTEEVFSDNSNEAYVHVKEHPGKPFNFKIKIRIQ